MARPFAKVSEEEIKTAFFIHLIFYPSDLVKFQKNKLKQHFLSI